MYCYSCMNEIKDGNYCYKCMKENVPESSYKYGSYHPEVR